MSTTDTNWDIEKGVKDPRLLFQGNPVREKDFKNFNFLKKDFESTIPEQEPAQFLHRRFKLLHHILKNNLSNSFYESKSDVGRPKKRFGDWTRYQWLWFVRKDTFHKEPKDSIQFQITVDTKEEGDLSISIWLDGVAENTRIAVLEKITKNKTLFMDLIKTLPNSYYVGIQKTDKSYFEEEISKIDDQFIENIITALSKRKTEFYITRYVSEEDAISYETEIIHEISDTFEKLIPISEFLGMKNTENKGSSLLKFVNGGWTTWTNYQPIIIKELLESGLKNNYSLPIKQI